MTQKIILKNTDATLTAGKQFAKRIEPGQLIYLQGNLGTGKTTFVRGILQGLGYIDAVKSPTFTLVEPYSIHGLAVYHFDLYRLKSSDELETIGFRDYFNGQNVCLIEWPEKAKAILPKAHFNIQIRIEGSQRLLTIY